MCALLRAALRDAPPGRAVVIVVLGVDLAHRRLARSLLVGMRDEPREPRDEKDRVAELVRKSKIRADGRNGAVDVDRQGPVEAIFELVERALGLANQPHVFAFELELERHLKEPRRARIASVKAMPEAG